MDRVTWSQSYDFDLQRLYEFSQLYPLYTLAGLYLTSLKLQSPRWQADTIPLDHAARAVKREFVDPSETARVCRP
jgi:hypothetical protein